MSVDSFDAWCDLYGAGSAVVQKAEEVLQGLEEGLQQIHAPMSVKGDPTFTEALARMLGVLHSPEISPATMQYFRKHPIENEVDALLGTVGFIEVSADDSPGTKLSENVSEACSTVKTLIQILVERGIIEAVQ